MIGKLSTAIKILLLFAFAAMPDNNVSDEEKPMELKTITRQKRFMSTIGFFNNRIKRANPANDKMSVSKKL